MRIRVRRFHRGWQVRCPCCGRGSAYQACITDAWRIASSHAEHHRRNP